MNPIKAWNRFLFGPISARPLGLYRIAFGVLMMIYLAVMTLEFDYWYTDNGLLQGTESREAAAVMRRAQPLRFSPLHYVHDPVTPRIVLAIAFAAALGVTLGWRTRVISVVLWLAHAHALPPQPVLQRRPRRHAGDPLVLHDALPGRRGLFARRPARGQAARDASPSR